MLPGLSGLRGYPCQFAIVTKLIDKAAFSGIASSHHSDLRHGKILVLTGLIDRLRQLRFGDAHTLPPLWPYDGPLEHLIHMLHSGKGHGIPDGGRQLLQILQVFLGQ